MSKYSIIVTIIFILECTVLLVMDRKFPENRALFNQIIQKNKKIMFMFGIIFLIVFMVEKAFYIELLITGVTCLILYLDLLTFYTLKK